MDERRDKGGSGGEEQRRPYGRREYDRQPGVRSPPRRGRRRYDLPPDGTEREPPGGAGASRRRRARRLGLGFGVVLVVAAVAAGLMLWRHGRHLRIDGQARARELANGPHLFVATVGLGPNTRDVTFPADVRGFSQSTVYAKIAGYVKSLAVDKGDLVRKGQLLGELESPEIDQQVAAAEADLVIKKRTFERYQQLVTKDFVSAQDFETVRAQFDVSRATLDQVRALQQYKTLRAPFAGTVTARYVDPGALIPAATGSTESALPLVDVADLRRLRVLVFVQQDVASLLRTGDPADLSVDQRPDLKIAARVTRISQALDFRSRAMLCEIWIDNPHHLYPGTFLHVTLHVQTPRVLVVPSSALLVWRDKPAVAVIQDSHVRFVEVKPGLDDGHIAQILSGLEPGQRVALAVPAEIADGALVQVTEKKEK
jgi:RND family efflux transporter MFP subunit